MVYQTHTCTHNIISQSIFFSAFMTENNEKCAENRGKRGPKRENCHFLTCSS